MRGARNRRQRLGHGIEPIISGIIAADNRIDLTLGLQLAMIILNEVLATEQINFIHATGI